MPPSPTPPPPSPAPPHPSPFVEPATRPPPPHPSSPLVSTLEPVSPPPPQPISAFPDQIVGLCMSQFAYVVKVQLHLMAIFCYAHQVLVMDFYALLLPANLPPPLMANYLAPPHTSPTVVPSIQGPGPCPRRLRRPQIPRSSVYLLLCRHQLVCVSKHLVVLCMTMYQGAHGQHTVCGMIEGD
jgi:hypothetical protein